MQPRLIEVCTKPVVVTEGNCLSDKIIIVIAHKVSVNKPRVNPKGRRQNRLRQKKNKKQVQVKAYRLVVEGTSIVGPMPVKAQASNQRPNQYK